MSVSAWSALAAYLLALIGSIALARRSTNWRMRLLAYTVALLPLCRGAIVLGQSQIWAQAVSEIAGPLELLICALCLTAIHLLNRENRDRRNTDVRLLLNEVIHSARRLPPPQTDSDPAAGAEERRKEPRFAANIPVTVATLGRGASPAAPGRVLDMSGGGLRVTYGNPIALRSSVKVEGDGILLLGEVIRCEASDGAYSLGVQVSEWLSLPEVANLYPARDRAEINSTARAGNGNGLGGSRRPGYQES